MTVAFVAQVLSAALTLLLYQVIAPELPGVLEEITLEKTPGDDGRVWHEWRHA